MFIVLKWYRILRRKIVLNNKKIIIILIITIALVIVFPLVIDWLIIGNSFPGNVSNSDWVVFFGGYIGAIIDWYNY